MKIYQNGHRFHAYKKWKDSRTYIAKKYDYASEGFFKHLMPAFVYSKLVDEDGNYKDTPLPIVVKFIEDSFIILMKFVERLQNYKNPTYTNR